LRATKFSSYFRFVLNGLILPRRCKSVQPGR